MSPDELAYALVSGAAVQLLDACRLLVEIDDVDGAAGLAVRAVAAAREQAIA